MLNPSAGGGNVIDKIKCKHKYAYDINKYLIALFQGLQNGEQLYDEVPRELYNEARKDYQNRNYTFTDFELGNIGFLASYNGRGFAGGFARAGWDKGRYRDYYQESKRNLLNQMPNLQDVIFECADYKTLSFENCLIYCDPPYQNTTKYSSSIDYDEFWQWCREMSKNNIILISEYNAPDDFKCIWQKTTNVSIRATNKSTATEKLFIYNP